MNKAISFSIWGTSLWVHSLRVFLNAAEQQTLFELRTATTAPQRVKDRAEVVRLSHQGCTSGTLLPFSTFFNWNIQTVRQTLHRWQQHGLEDCGMRPALALNLGSSLRT